MKRILFTSSYRCSSDSECRLCSVDRRRQLRGCQAMPRERLADVGTVNLGTIVRKSGCMRRVRRPRRRSCPVCRRSAAVRHLPQRLVRDRHGRKRRTPRCDERADVDGWQQRRRRLFGQLRKYGLVVCDHRADESIRHLCPSLDRCGRLRNGPAPRVAGCRDDQRQRLGIRSIRPEPSKRHRDGEPDCVIASCFAAQAGVLTCPFSPGGWKCFSSTSFRGVTRSR